MNTTLRERIDTELTTTTSPEGFTMVYKENLMKIIDDYEKEVEIKLNEPLTSTELGYLKGITR